MRQAHSDGSTSKWAFWRWQEITRADQQPYLTRLILFRCPWFSVYLHWFRGNDDLCMHDHPWWFLSLILWGGYFEWTPHGDNHQMARWFGPGSILFRRADWVHRVELLRELDGRLRPAVTLVITGPKTRPWGFHTRFGWIPWREYHWAKHCPEE